MASEIGGWGAPCYTEGQCGPWLACEGDAANVGGESTILGKMGKKNFIIFLLVTERTCRPKGWAIGGGTVMFVFALLVLSLCICFCYRLRRRRRESRRGSEGSLVMF